MKEDGKVSQIGPGVHAARHKHGDAVAELRLIGLYLGQHLRQDLIQCLAASKVEVPSTDTWLKSVRKSALSSFVS